MGAGILAGMQACRGMRACRHTPGRRGRQRDMACENERLPSVAGRPGDRQAEPGCAAKKAYSTQRSSQAVPHPSTNRALCCLTSDVERDPVHSTRYGRQRTL